MTEQMKKSFKMLGYTFGIRQSVVFMVLFTVFGIVTCLRKGNLGSMGGFFIILMGMWPVQLIQSLPGSQMVQASPWKKALQTWVPTLIGFVCFVAGYLIVLLLRLPGSINADAAELSRMSGEMLLMGTTAFLLMVYCGAAYKFMVASTVIFLVLYMGGTMAYNIIFVIFERSLNISVQAAAVIGLIEIVAGAFAQYGISLLLYKYPISKHAQFRQLQKYM